MPKWGNFVCLRVIFNIRNGEKSGKKHYKIFRGFYKPKGYVITNEDKIASSDIYSSADNASQKAINLNIKSNESGESSR